MTKEPKPGVIGSLPRTRPHRRSDKRPAPVGAPPIDTRAQEPGVVKAAQPPKAKSVRQAPPKPAAVKAIPSAKPMAVKAKPAAAKAKPAAVKAKPAAAKAKPAAAKAKPATASPTPAPPREPAPGALETAVQAAAELAEIGLHAGARALRRAVSRLPRP